MKSDTNWNQEISLDEMLSDDLFQQMLIADKADVPCLKFLLEKIDSVSASRESTLYRHSKIINGSIGVALLPVKNAC